MLFSWNGEISMITYTSYNLCEYIFKVGARLFTNNW